LAQESNYKIELANSNIAEAEEKIAKAS